MIVKKEVVNSINLALGALNTHMKLSIDKECVKVRITGIIIGFIDEDGFNPLNGFRFSSIELRQLSVVTKELLKAAK